MEFLPYDTYALCIATHMHNVMHAMAWCISICLFTLLRGISTKQLNGSSWFPALSTEATVYYEIIRISPEIMVPYYPLKPCPKL